MSWKRTHPKLKYLEYPNEPACFKCKASRTGTELNIYGFCQECHHPDFIQLMIRAGELKEQVIRLHAECCLDARPIRAWVKRYDAGIMWGGPNPHKNAYIIEFKLGTPDDALIPVEKRIADQFPEIAKDVGLLDS